MTSHCKCPCSLKSPHWQWTCDINNNFCKKTDTNTILFLFFPLGNLSVHIFIAHSSSCHEDILSWPLLPSLFLPLPFPLHLFIHPESFTSIFMSQIHRILCILMKYMIKRWEKTINSTKFVKHNYFHLHPFSCKNIHFFLL